MLMLFAQQTVAQTDENSLTMMVAGVTAAAIAGTILGFVRHHKVMGTERDKSAGNVDTTTTNVNEIDRIVNRHPLKHDIKNHENKFL